MRIGKLPSAASLSTLAKTKELASVVTLIGTEAVTAGADATFNTADKLHRDPRAFGSVKADLLKIVQDRRRSSIAQYFTLESMKVDPATLTWEVVGTMHSMVGRAKISAAPKVFHHGWVYNGMRQDAA